MLQLKHDTHSIIYKSYSPGNYESIRRLEMLSGAERFEMRVVGNVLPFKTNNYVVNELINWNNVPGDPIFKLTFPQC